MNFYEMILKLKDIYINEIILVSYGAFYIAIGEDAVLINKKCSECPKNIHKEKTDYEIALERYLEIEVGE